MTDKYDDYHSYDSDTQKAVKRFRQYVEEPTWEDEEPNAFWGLVITFLVIVLSALAFFAVCMTIYHVMLPSFYWTIGQIGRLIGDGPAVFLGSCLWLSTFIVSLIKSTPGAALYSGYHWIVIFTLINAVAIMRAMISPWGG